MLSPHKSGQPKTFLEPTKVQGQATHGRAGATYLPKSQELQSESAIAQCWPSPGTKEGFTQTHYPWASRATDTRAEEPLPNPALE